jgi:hypothetical protein
MRRFWRENSLSIVFLALFIAALAGQAYAGWHEFNDEALGHHQATISLGRFLLSSSFGNAVMENWQSEFLAVGSMAVMAIYLRQRGSPESKPVGAPHAATGTEG